MPRLNFHLEPGQMLASIQAQMGARAFNGYASFLIQQNDFRQKAKELTAQYWLRGWPKVRQSGTKQMKVQIAPGVYDRLHELSEYLGLSMSRTTLIWLQLAAEAIHHAQTQNGASMTTIQISCAEPVRSQQTVSSVRIDFGGIYPPAPGEQVLTRVVGGRSETWLHCRIHKDMTADQVRDIGNAGAMWVDSDIYQAVMDQKLNLNQMMELVVQRRTTVGNSSTAGQVIELPLPARAVTKASAATAITTATTTDTGFGLDAVAWMAQAASVWDKQP